MLAQKREDGQEGKERPPKKETLISRRMLGVRIHQLASLGTFGTRLELQRDSIPASILPTGCNVDVDQEGI
jgi:hypothetical protein